MKKRGFTLIELLTVIAIIAILAAIIFPVASMARERARRASCQSNLNNLVTSLKQYKLNEGGYPPVLLGYLEPYATAPTVADIQHGALYKDFVKDINTFKCPDNTTADNKTATAVTWPNIVVMPPTVGTAPTSTRWLNQTLPIDLTGQANPNPNRQYYKFDSYDIGVNSISGNNELRYTLFWTDVALNSTIKNKQGDSLRQLGYKNPDESAIVTWCSFHYSKGKDSNTPALPEHAGNALVLFLDGSVKTVDQQVMAKYGWSYHP